MHALRKLLPSGNYLRRPATVGPQRNTRLLVSITIKTFMSHIKYFVKKCQSCFLSTDSPAPQTSCPLLRTVEETWGCLGFFPTLITIKSSYILFIYCLIFFFFFFIRSDFFVIKATLLHGFDDMFLIQLLSSRKVGVQALIFSRIQLI